MSKVEYKSTGDITAEVLIDGQKVKCSKFQFYHDTEGVPVAEITIVNPGLNLTSLNSKVIKHDRTIESIKEKICDEYCKMPEYYLEIYEDPDKANEVMVNNCCCKCPLERLNK